MFTRVRELVKSSLGPAFVEHDRDLTPEGLTKPGHGLGVGDTGPGRVVVVIPAHNEASRVAEALESLAAQTRVADLVVVLDDRSTDDTGAIALAHDVHVGTTIDNRDRKAGAQNQLLAYLLPRLSDNDAVLMMDADSSLSPTFVSDAAERLREPSTDGRPIGGVGGIFLGYPLRGLLAHLQNNEYVRYAGEIGRRRGRADVLTGTATLFSVRALRDVLHARASGRLPRGSGVYDVEALTEDNELTLALKHLGYHAVSPKELIVGTELMPTVSRLFYQRLRWQRGALENLLAYGLTRSTIPYFLRQLMMYAAVAFVPFFLTTLTYTWIVGGSIPWSWFWFFITAFAVLERILSVRRGGWRAVALAALVIPELIYDLFLHYVYVRALTDTMTRADATWGHTETPQPASTPRANAWRRSAGPVYMAAALALIVALALISAIAGVAWHLIAAAVLAGVALAALRLSGLDPLGPFLGTGELDEAARAAGTATARRFGGSALSPIGVQTWARRELPEELDLLDVSPPERQQDAARDEHAVDLRGS